MGRLGVVFFFVLSGFLITTIVAKTDDFTYLRFQGRRALRILPVYFAGLAFTLLSGFFVGNAFTDHNFWEERLLLYLFFLPNLAFNMFSVGGFPSQLWSVGSEIQFYLLWPVLITLFRKTLLQAFIFVISCVSFLKLALHLVIISGFSLEVVKGLEAYSLSLAFVRMQSFDCLAVGAVFSLLAINRGQNGVSERFLFSPIVQFAAPAIILGLFASGFGSGLFDHLIYSVFFGLIIANLALNKSSKFSLENKFLNYSGAISYGLYVYHPLVLLWISYLYRDKTWGFSFSSP